MARVSSSLPGSYGGGSNIKRTSQLINDGEFPNDGSRFIESNEISSIIEQTVVDIGYNDKNHYHTQDVPAQIWNIPHTLEKVVAVTITDTAGTEIHGKVVKNTGTLVIIEFNVPVMGYAALN